jgi:2-dehydro-3-deoxyphosphogalactonate aldolase
MNPTLAKSWQQAMAALPLVAILRGLRPEEAEPVGAVLVGAGWRLLEVPLNSPEPLASIATLARRFPAAIVGAGTVRSGEEVRAVHAAGGRLIVSPHFDARVVEAAVALEMVCLPGVMTPSEAFAALAAGATGIKLFPAEMIPPAAVKALRSVLPRDALLLPVGGIAPLTMGPYRAAGANGFGIGSALYQPGRAIDAIAASAQAFADAWTGTMRA